MTVQPLRESDSLARCENELRVLRAVLEIAKIVRSFSCEERQDIERRVKEIIR